MILLMNELNDRPSFFCHKKSSIFLVCFCCINSQVTIWKILMEKEYRLFFIKWCHCESYMQWWSLNITWTIPATYKLTVLIAKFYFFFKKSSIILNCLKNSLLRRLLILGYIFLLLKSSTVSTLQEQSSIWPKYQKELFT